MDRVKKGFLSERWWFRGYIAITLRRTKQHFSQFSLGARQLTTLWDRENPYYCKKYYIGIYLFFKLFKNFLKCDFIKLNISMSVKNLIFIWKLWFMSIKLTYIYTNLLSKRLHLVYKNMLSLFPLLASVQAFVFYVLDYSISLTSL